MKKLAVLLAVTSSLLLIGCEKNPSEAVQTVDWYKEHKAERVEMLTKCKANPGELMATPNCVNASRAASAITWGAKGGISPVEPLKPEETARK
jgi:hypothetical protein